MQGEGKEEGEEGRRVEGQRDVYGGKRGEEGRKGRGREGRGREEKRGRGSSEERES